MGFRLVYFSGGSDVLSMSIVKIIETEIFVKMFYLEDMTEEDGQITSMMLTMNLSVEPITCLNKETHLHSRSWVSHLQKTYFSKYIPTWTYHTLSPNTLCHYCLSILYQVCFLTEKIRHLPSNGEVGTEE